MTKSKLNGLILAGGKSSRMGVDKGSLEYFGKPQRDHLAELLRPFCQNVYISLSHSSDHTIPPDCGVIEDALENLEGPLNGILSALNTNDQVAWLTVPVDMPLLDASMLNHLIINRDEKKIATCFVHNKIAEPLLTIWEPASIALLNDFYQVGGQSPLKFLQQQLVHMLAPPDPEALKNINSSDELTAFLTHSKKKI